MFFSYYERELYMLIYNNIISIIVKCNRSIPSTKLFYFLSVLHFETLLIYSAIITKLEI